jgi:hypothetical protein
MLKLPSDKIFIPRISIRQGSVLNLTSKRARRLARARAIRMMVGFILMATILYGIILFMQKLIESPRHSVTIEKQISIQPSRITPTTVHTPKLPESTLLRSSVPLPTPPPAALSEGPDNQETYQIGRQATTPPPLSIPPELPKPQEPQDSLDGF